MSVSEDDKTTDNLSLYYGRAHMLSTILYLVRKVLLLRSDNNESNKKAAFFTEQVLCNSI